MEFRDPEKVLKGGCDVHVYFKIEQLETAVSFYNSFLGYLSSKGITPTCSSFSKRSDGPHIGPNFTIQLMGINPTRDIQQEGGAPRAIFCIGHALTFAQLNRPSGFRVLIHPSFAEPFGDVAEEIIDHTKRAAWLSDDAPPACLSINFFDNLLLKDGKEAKKEAEIRLLAATSGQSDTDSFIRNT